MTCLFCKEASLKDASRCFFCGRDANSQRGQAREQIIESVLEQSDASWRTQCAEFMRVNSITLEEVEEEIKLSQKLGQLIIDLQAKVVLAELISEYTELVHNGTEYEGNCPFEGCHMLHVR
jgi:hypothetical protein